MNLYIGKIQNDSVVKYIALPYREQYQDVPRILKTFYPTGTRVDALLNLGNLVNLQPSPYNKWKGGVDKVHCRAEIRDDGEKKANTCRDLPTPSMTMPVWMLFYSSSRMVAGISKP